jgi:sugar phosphate isomerase/epimerase
MNRRELLRVLAAGAVVGPARLLRARIGTTFAKWPAIGGKRHGLPLAFSTLACPDWGWDKILEFASQHGFSAIELRGLERNMDLPTHPIFAADRIEQTKRQIAAHKLRIACVSSSAQLYLADPEKREKQMADARRFIDLAAKLEGPYVRVFGGKDASDTSLAPDAATKNRVAAGLRELGEYSGPRHVTVIIESHDHFTASSTLKDVLRAADSPHVGLLWDAHHTFATSNEDPKFTVQQLGPWIRHTHLKDSVGSGEDRKYVLTGQGNVPVRKQIEALLSIGYKGFYCFEWEKVWHPDLADPEIAIADYAKAMRKYEGELR